jgi:hypothetical protein
MRKILILVLLAALVVGGGLYFMRRGGTPGDAGAEGNGGGGSVDRNAPLAFVPANTPYVFANIEPFPAAITARWMQQFDVAARVWQSQLALGIAKLEQTRPEAEELKWLRAVNAELEGKTMEQVFDALGYDLQGRFALYGVGLVPVMRISLADPEKFKAFIARLEKHVGSAFPRGTVAGQEYFNLVAPEGKLRGILALQDRQLVLTLAPAAGDEALPELLGVQRPAKSLGEAGTLAALNRQFAYLPNGSGYFDTRLLLEQFSAPATPLQTAFLTALEIQKPALDPVCASEYAAMTGAVPRLSFGYTRLDAQHMDLVSRLETNAAIAADLRTLRAPMPGLDKTADAPFNFGVSLKLAALPPLVSKWASAIAAAPWQCEALKGLNEGAAQSQQQLANPVVFGAAPVFEGLHLIATRIELKSMNEAPDFAGKLLIGSPNPAALLGMAKSFAPPLASVQLAPDGKVHALPALPEMPAGMPAFAAMTKNVLGLAVGTGEDKDLAEYMSADPARQPLLVLGYSGALFAQFNKIMLEQAAAVADPAEAASQKEMAELMGQLYGQMRRTEIRLEFGEHGIEMHQSAELN